MSIPDSPRGIFSCWVLNHGGGGHPTFFMAGKYLPPGPVFTQQFTNDALVYGIEINQFNFQLSSGASLIYEASTLGFPLTDFAWHHVLFSWDFSGGSAIATIHIDDVFDFTSLFDPSPFFVPWSFYDAFTVLRQVGYPGSGGKTPFFGCVSELYLNTQEFLDFTITSNRRKFISASLLPVPLGSNGELPTGTSPSFYFTGGATSFPTNLGSGGSFTKRGGIIDCNDLDPGEVVWFFSQGIVAPPFSVLTPTDFSNWTGAGPFFGLTISETTPGEQGELWRLNSNTLPWIVQDTSPGELWSQFIQFGGANYLFGGSDTGGFAEIFKSTDPAGIIFAPDFAAPESRFSSSVVFLGDLYAGTDSTTGAMAPPVIRKRIGPFTWPVVQAFGGGQTKVNQLVVRGAFMYAAVSSPAGGELWRTPDGTVWTLLFTFPFGLTQFTGLAEYNGNFYAAVNDGFFSRETFISEGTNDTAWYFNNFFFPISFPSKTGNLVVHGGFLFLALGGSPEASIFRYDGRIWLPSVNFNVQFGDPNPEVSVLGLDSTGNKLYAATGPGPLVNIYTYPLADLP